jgi:hypothetical protein
MESLWYWLVPAAVILGLMYFFWRVGRRYAGDLDAARTHFVEQQPSLQNAFFLAASTAGKPRGLRWKECQWDNHIEWLRDKQTRQLWALAGVTISFEAIEGGDMEGIAAVGDLRNATAVFFYQDGRWQTAGRTVFNLGPSEAAAHFSDGFENLKTLTIDN